MTPAKVDGRVSIYAVEQLAETGHGQATPGRGGVALVADEQSPSVVQDVTLGM
jgi:hypothetical protein